MSLPGFPWEVEARGGVTNQLDDAVNLVERYPDGSYGLRGNEAQGLVQHQPSSMEPVDDSFGKLGVYPFLVPYQSALPATKASDPLSEQPQYWPLGSFATVGTTLGARRLPGWD